MILLLLIVLYFVCIISSFYFSGSEAGYLSLNTQKHQVEINRHNTQAQRVDTLVQNPARLLGVTLFGNNLVNVATTNLTFWISTILSRYINHAFDLMFLLSVVLLFTLGEVLPKLIFKKYSNKLIYKSSVVMVFFDKLFNPFTVFISWLSNFLLLPFKIEKGVDFLNRNDFENILNDSHKDGLVEKDERYFFNTVSSLSTIKVLEVMTPLADLYLVNKEQNIVNIIDALKSEKSYIFPVFERRVDNIIGYCDILTVFNSEKKRKFAKDFIIETSYIPETLTLDKAYEVFNQKDSKALIVVDEYGGCRGILFLDELIDRIFGISYGMNETNKSSLINEVEKGKFEIDCSFDIDDLNEKLSLNIPKEGYETLGGFINFHNSKILNKGDVFKYKNISFTVLASRPTGVDKVIIQIDGHL